MGRERSELQRDTGTCFFFFWWILNLGVEKLFFREREREREKKKKKKKKKKKEGF